jgi:hypothetical protein
MFPNISPIRKQVSSFFEFNEFFQAKMPLDFSTNYKYTIHIYSYFFQFCVITSILFASFYSLLIISPSYGQKSF